MFTPVTGLWNETPLSPNIADIADCSFEHGAVLAVNLGDDADTTGAVHGQIAGEAHQASPSAGVRSWHRSIFLKTSLNGY